MYRAIEEAGMTMTEEGVASAIEQGVGEEYTQRLQEIGSQERAYLTRIMPASIVEKILNYES